MAFTLSFAVVGTAGAVEGERVILKVFEMPFNFAVMIAVCVDFTAATVALKPLLSAFRLTMIWLGTWTAGLLLDREM